MSQQPYDPDDKFNSGGQERVPAKDDPYRELFADCRTPEQVLQLQQEIDEAERS